MWCKGAKSMQVDLMSAGSHRTMPGLIEQPSPSILGPRCRSCKTVPKMQTSYITTATSSYLQIDVVQARHRGGHCGSTWSSSSWSYLVQTLTGPLNVVQMCKHASRFDECGITRSSGTMPRTMPKRCPVWWSSPRQAYLAHAAGLARQFLKCRHPTLQQQHHRICRLLWYKLVIVVDIVVQRGLLLPGAIWYRLTKCRHATAQQQHHRICRLVWYKLVIVVDIVVQRGLLLPGAIWYRH